MSVQKEHFGEFYMSSCRIGEQDEYLFLTEKPKEIPDPFTVTDFMHVFYRAGIWDSRLAMTDINFYAGYVSRPDKAWIMVSFFGSVLRIDNNGRVWENDIPPHEITDQTTIVSTKVIDGKLYAVSPWRVIRRRDDVNKWTILDNGFPDMEKIDFDNSVMGFTFIDGFSENDIYAVGLNADVWHWDGEIWKQIEVPTNADIKAVVCGGDGLVYLSTDANTFLVGKNNRWEIIKYDVDNIFRDNLVWFKDRVYMGYASTIYEIKDGQFRKSKLNNLDARPADVSFFDANDDVMLVGSKLEIATFNGEDFDTILPFKFEVS